MKRILVGLAIVSAAIGGSVAYYWNRATALPDWYTEAPGETRFALAPLAQVPTETSQTEQIDETVTVESILNQNLTADPVAEGRVPLEVTLSEADLNQVMATAIAQEPQAGRLLASAKGVQTTIEGDRIQSGAVMNLSEIPASALPREGQQALTQLTERFPRLSNRDIYVGIEGSPQLKGDRLSLGDDAVIRIGRMSLAVDDIAYQLGISQTELERQLSALLTQQGLTPERVQIVDGQLVISGTVPAQ